MRRAISQTVITVIIWKSLGLSQLQNQMEEDIVYISAITSSQNPLLERFESDFRFLRSYLK